MITLYIDFKCPASYLALDPTLALAKRKGVDIFWKPFRSRQSAIPPEREGETRGETHRRVRAVQRRETHKRYAVIGGLEMNFRDDPGTSDAALAALSLDVPNPLGFVREAFEIYWTSDADLNNVTTVAGLLSATENPVPEKSLRGAHETFEDYQSQSEDDGIFITPTYIIGGHVFVGREHLPLIEKTLMELG